MPPDEARPATPFEEPRRSLLISSLPREAIVSIAVFAAVWQTMSYLAPALGIPAFAIPGLGRIAKSLATIAPLDIAVTLGRVLLSLVVSFAVGLVVAIVMYLSESVEKYLRPMVRILMAVPVVSWILFAVLWFKGVEFRIVFVLVVVCAPVFTVDALDNMREVSKELKQMIRSFRPTSLQFFHKLMLPAITPGLITSWKITLSLAIRVVTIAELVGAVTGIGHQLSVAQELFSVADVFAWTLVLVVLLFFLEALLVRLETRVLRWRA
ncbi:NitT/TauT family transport system permease protein [Nitrobacteraceae bacterium AZCC 2161]